jgi:hypothetical protein
MIDTQFERLIEFAEAAKVLPERCRPHPSTWWRWGRRGCRGVKLETVTFGRHRLTSVEAVHRFMAAVTAAADHSAAPIKNAPEPASESVALLSKAGIL